jgi:hypothetical protein
MNPRRAFPPGQSKWFLSNPPHFATDKRVGACSILRIIVLVFLMSTGGDNERI